MPVYEYACTKCGKMTEKVLSITSKKKKIICNHCGGESRKIISSSSFKMNGYCEANGYSKA